MSWPEAIVAVVLGLGMLGVVALAIVMDSK